MKKTKKTVLVVTADTRLGDVYAKRLTAEGFIVKTVSRGAKALSAIAEKNPSCVLYDVDIPKENAFEILSEVHASSNVPIVALSKRGTAADIAAARSLGIQSFCLKLHCTPTQVLDLVVQNAHH